MKKDLNFLSLSIKILYLEEYSESDLHLIYKTIINYNDKDINNLLSCQSLSAYQNNLEIYLEIISLLMNIFKKREDYDKCIILKNISDSIKLEKIK